MNTLTRRIGAGVTLLTFSDNKLLIDTTDGAAQIYLPKASEFVAFIEQRSGNAFGLNGISFSDIGLKASVNNITFIAAEEETIGGASTLVISTDGSSGNIGINADNSSWSYVPSKPNSSNGGGGTYQTYTAIVIDYWELSPYPGDGAFTAPGLVKCFPASGGGGNSMQFTSFPFDITFEDLEFCYLDIRIETGGYGADVNFPKLKNSSNGFNLYLQYLQNCNFPLLEKVNEVNVYGVTSLNLDSLKTASFIYVEVAFALSESFNLSSITNITTVLSVINCSYLKLLTLPSSIDTFIGTDIILSGNSLTEDCVNDILIKVDSYTHVPTSLDLSGGANAAPSGAGLTAKANLILKGCIVTTN
jgi:hypothetical protein